MDFGGLPLLFDFFSFWKSSCIRVKLATNSQSYWFFTFLITGRVWFLPFIPLFSMIWFCGYQQLLFVVKQTVPKNLMLHCSAVKGDQFTKGGKNWVEVMYQKYFPDGCLWVFLFLVLCKHFTISLLLLCPQCSMFPINYIDLLYSLSKPTGFAIISSMLKWQMWYKDSRAMWYIQNKIKSYLIVHLNIHFVT